MEQSLGGNTSSLFFISTEEDFEFEEKIVSNPYMLKTWLAYIKYKQTFQSNSDQYNNIINVTFERALSYLPGSYKLWNMYLDVRIVQCESLHPITRLDPVELINQVFEKSLITMHRMPLIWLKYLKFIVRYQPSITYVRSVLNRALQALPLTQHQIIWKFISMEWILNPQSKVPTETGRRLLKRYLRLEPSFINNYVDYLNRNNCYTELCELYIYFLNYASTQVDSKTNSSSVASNHSPLQIWEYFCDILGTKALSINMPHSKIENTLLSGIKRYPSEVGKLWTTLAQYYIQYGKFDIAMGIYEKGMESVSTVKDWNLIFDTYAKLFDELIKVQMSDLQSENPDKALEAKLEILIAKYEGLMDRRALLLNTVKLKQNPSHVHEWHNRIKLLKAIKDHERVIEAYEQAIQNIKSDQATHGKLFTIWNSYARFFEMELKSIEKAREVYDRCLSETTDDSTNILSVVDLERVVTDYAEMELRNNNPQQALAILFKATHPNDKSNTLSCQRSLLVWSFLLDLEESTTKNIKRMKKFFNEMIDLKIVTPNTVINFTNLLIENKYFEEAFKIFERATSLFHYPQVFPIWMQYLLQFVNRYQHTKSERSRDMFEQAIKNLPFYSIDRAAQEFASEKKYIVKNQHARDFFLLYANFEENYGISSKAINVYDRATKSVTPNSQEQFQLYQLYITRITETYGVAKAREVIDLALNQSVEMNNAKEESYVFIRDLALKYVYMELKLGEVDRARSIFAFASSFCNPDNTDHFTKFWDRWQKFEKCYGNLETFKEYLRVRRFVQQQYSSSNTAFKK
ncbi:predicted protein [Naegleria gruberi]|uniref:Predicted protein n=1 Tax=Naegleria gruberi TaxID=5762 RepID=D2UYW7_NAEGR|nr:uncharacterized protein NAEGRDRAFT_29703 [Naegleria gruberi]EFC49847.1 predicted protein [Naegleria gruberi]|eukprot:XP_002682591.1 predicted protein [Naegleria gruberi strain NEG-M]